MHQDVIMTLILQSGKMTDQEFPMFIKTSMHCT